VCEDFEWISLPLHMVDMRAVVKTFTDFGVP